MSVKNNSINDTADSFTVATGNLTVTAGDAVITAGDALVGATSADAVAKALAFRKSRSGAVITSGDALGTATFQGHDGTQYINASKITSTSSGTIATNRIASDLKFYTHPDSTTASTLRMTIASTGAVTIATPDSGTGLTVSGGLEAPLLLNAQTDTYTLVLADAGKLVTMDKATANTLTVPKNSSVAFPIGTEVLIYQKGAGKTTLAPVDVDVTLRSSGALLSCGAQYAVVALVKIDTNVWMVGGDRIS